MNLKNTQAPLKEQYRIDPQSALITLRANGNLGESISCKVETGHAMIEAGLHPATGGSGLQACSGDLLLQALVACAGVTLSAVATSIGIDITEGAITAEGDLDFRGTLAVSKEAPVGFTAIRLHISITSNATEAEIGSLLKLTERYCVVYQTLSKGVPLKVDLKQTKR